LARLHPGQGYWNPMIKIDIVKRIGQHLKLKDAEALAVVDAILDSIKETIIEHERLEIRDFGVFQTKLRKPRVGRNPRNRKEYPIPPRRVVTFKLGKELKDFSVQSDSEGNSGSAPSSSHQDSFIQGDQD
jgi:DNA-binding protein HU-beta